MEQQAKSCFLPGTNIQFAIDSTSLALLQSCPYKYKMVIIDGWVPKGQSVHLTFGIHYHTAIQNYEIYKAAGDSHKVAMRRAIKQLLVDAKDFNPEPINKATRYKNRETLLALTIDYFDKFADDVAKTVILENGKPAVELSFRFELNWKPEGYDQPYLLCGHLDRVVEYNESNFVLDHKTTTSTPTQHFFEGFNPNIQMTIYTIAGKVVMDSPIKGVIIDAAQIMLEKPNTFQRGFTYRTPDILDEWLMDLRFWLQQAKTFSDADYWPMNNTSCGNYGGCEFRDICSKSPGVRETFLKGSFEQLEPSKRWNPLITRESGE